MAGTGLREALHGITRHLPGDPPRYVRRSVAIRHGWRPCGTVYDPGSGHRMARVLDIDHGLAQDDVHLTRSLGDQRQHRVAVAPAPWRAVRRMFRGVQPSVSAG